jgi:chaperonin GroES
MIEPDEIYDDQDVQPDALGDALDYVEDAFEEVPLILSLAQADGDITDLIPEDKLSELGRECVTGYTDDDNARSEWKTATEKALSSAAQDAPEAKNYPFDGAANVQYPMITVAAQQFAARAYPALVKPGQVVDVAVIGVDREGVKAARAERVKTFLNYQIFYRIKDWEGDTDVLLNQLPITGCGFRKVYYDYQTRRPCAEFVNALNLIVPQDAKSLDDAPRITQVFELFPWQIKEKIRLGLYRDAQFAGVMSGEGQGAEAEEQTARKIIEQHRLHDMDDDGIEEPYIVTVDVESQEVLRIEAAYSEVDLKFGPDGQLASVDRWCPFVKYSFLPDPKGRFYDIGFGHLLAPISAVINTIINQLLDAGNAQVAGGGFLAQGLRLQGSGQMNVLRWRPGEYKVVNAPAGNIAQSIYERPVPQPSPVLFEMLGMLMDAAKDISSVKDVLTGEAGRNQTATATLALIEQGLQTFTAIYKRIYRAAKREYELLYECVARYGDPEEYQRVLDDPSAFLAQDFNEQDLDIQPVSDPQTVTNMQRMAKAQFMMQFLGKGLNDQEILTDVWEAAGIQDTKRFFPEPQPQVPQQPDPKVMSEIARNEAQAGNYQASAIKSRADAMRALAETAEKMSGQGRVGPVEGEPDYTLGFAGTGNGGAAPGSGVA